MVHLEPLQEAMGGAGVGAFGRRPLPHRGPHAGVADPRHAVAVQNFLPFIVIGITAGSVYGLAGTGLVLTYKTSGIFNFPYGSLAALSVFVFYFLHNQHGLPWPYAALICL